MDGSFLLVSSSGYEMLCSFLGSWNFFSSTKLKKPFFFIAWMICTHTHTHKEFTQLTKSMEQSPSWEVGHHLANRETPHLSWDQRFITLPTTAHHIWKPVSHLAILRFFSWQTVKCYGEPIPYSSRRQLILRGTHSRYSIHFF